MESCMKASQSFWTKYMLYVNTKREYIKKFCKLFKSLLKQKKNIYVQHYTFYVLFIYYHYDHFYYLVAISINCKISINVYQLL